MTKVPGGTAANAGGATDTAKERPGRPSAKHRRMRLRVTTASVSISKHGRAQ
jgi:hypothetical protein